MLPDASRIKQYSFAAFGRINTGCAMATERNTTIKICKIKLMIPVSLLILVTDKTYAETGNVEIVNLAASESNFAVTDVTYTLKGGKLTVEGKAVSYAEGVNAPVRRRANKRGNALLPDIQPRFSVRLEIHAARCVEDKTVPVNQIFFDKFVNMGVLK